MMRKKAVIFTGGVCNLGKIDNNIAEDADLILAADSGYHKAVALEIKPQMLIGDFDSIFDGQSEKAFPTDIEIRKSPCEKDETDTMLACEIAVEAGARELLIVGGTGGRADHGLSNILYLENLAELLHLLFLYFLYNIHWLHHNVDELQLYIRHNHHCF